MLINGHRTCAHGFVHSQKLTFLQLTDGRIDGAESFAPEKERSRLAKSPARRALKSADFARLARNSQNSVCDKRNGDSHSNPACLFHPWKREKSPAFHASRSPGVLRSQSGRISLVAARRSCQRSTTDGRPQNQ
jgi:hypothetical protein